MWTIVAQWLVATVGGQLVLSLHASTEPGELLQWIWSATTDLTVTHAGIAAGVGKAFSHVCLFVCLFVRALTGKRLELSTPNFVHVYSIAVARHALTHRSKVKVSHTVTTTVTVARLLVTTARISLLSKPLCYLRPLPEWVCMSIRLFLFPSSYYY